jgi:hypothetical protein
MKHERGLVRTNQSNLVGVSTEDMNEAGFFLASTLRNTDSMASYGKNPRTCRTVALSHPLLPSPFMSIANLLFFQQQIQKALERLMVLHSRAFILAHDETVFNPGFQGVRDSWAMTAILFSNLFCYCHFQNPANNSIVTSIQSSPSARVHPILSISTTSPGAPDLLLFPGRGSPKAFNVSWFPNVCSMSAFTYRGFDLIHNLDLPEEVDQPYGHGVVIGQEWSTGMAVPYKASNPLPRFEFKSLASMQLSYHVARCDTNQHIYEICKIPRKKDGHTKVSEFEQLGTVLATICVTNHDMPPIATSQDFHGSHLRIMMMFLGLLNPTFYNTIPFFQYATFKPLYLTIPFFVYSVLFYKEEQPVFNQGERVRAIVYGMHILF